MPLTLKLPIVLFASVAALAGCKKPSEQPAAKAGSAAPAPAPPAPSGLIVKDDGYKAIAGTYDSTKAIAVADRSHFQIVVPLNCGPDFGCGIATQWANSIDGEKFAAACPKGVALHISFEDINSPDDPKPGKHSASLYAVEGEGTQTSLHTGDVVVLTEKTADSASGNVSWTDGASGINGPFKATVCKPPK